MTPEPDPSGAARGNVTRRGFLLAGLGGLVWAVPALARGPESDGDGLITSSQRRAVDRGLEWIAGNASSAGIWGDQAGTRVADTALSLLALMAGGNLVVAGSPDPWSAADRPESAAPSARGLYGDRVEAGIRYLARLAWSAGKQGRVHGYIQDDQDSRMHGHGFATLTLATAAANLGGRPVRVIREDVVSGAVDPAVLPLADQVRWGLHLAVTCTERAQDPDTGGWLYEPDAQGHEGSMTITQISALRAARDVGIDVSGAVLRRAYDYVRTSQNLHDPKLFGGFAYQKTQKSRVSYPLTAAALSTLYGLGRYGMDEQDRKMIRDGFKYMDRNFEDWLDAHQWFYYAMFYGAQAIYQSQEPEKLRNQWPKIREAVMSHQRGSGQFNPVGGDGRSVEYSTAMGVLTLQVPMETLPFFQRR